MSSGTIASGASGCIALAAAVRPTASGSPTIRRRSALRTIARDTVVEALRGRWLWLAIGATLAVAACATFVRSLALTETQEVGLAFAGPLARLGAVVIVVLTTVASMVREQSERTMLLALAAPVGRASWLLGKALGFATIAAMTGVLLALPVLLQSATPAAAAWTASLVLELMLIATVTLAIARVVGQVAPAAGAALAFYLFARLLHIVLLLGARAQNYSDLETVGALVRLIGAVIPRLDLFSRTEWLLGTAPAWPDLGAVVLQAFLYTALALAAAIVDLRRATLA